MGVRINRPVLDDILVDHGVERERVERLKIMIKEEPHLVPKDRSIIVRALKRFAALFQKTTGDYFLDTAIIIYKTRIELALTGLDDTLAHECGHFLDDSLWERSWRTLMVPCIVRPFTALYEALRAERVANRSAKTLMKDPRWHKVIEIEKENRR